jgi:hypothetical protein
MNKVFLASMIAVLGSTQAMAADVLPPTLVGTWKGSYKADCSEAGCSGETTLTISATGAGMVARAVNDIPGIGVADRGTQPLVQEGSGWSATYPAQIKVILVGDPATGKLSFTLDPRVNPKRLGSKVGTGTLIRGN